MNKENCALKLVDEIILYYDARSKKNIKLLGLYKYEHNPQTLRSKKVSLYTVGVIPTLLHIHISFIYH